MQKYGIGNWKQIYGSGYLLGKSIAQMVCMAEKMMGTQTIGQFQGLHLNVDIIKHEQGQLKVSD